MIIKRLWSKIRRNKDYKNRFVKFYHLNKKRLDTERKQLYHQKQKKGICVRCNQKSFPDKIFCDYHRELQKGYNRKARLGS